MYYNVVVHYKMYFYLLRNNFVFIIYRPLTIPSITLPPSATDAFSAGKFTTKFEGDDSVDTAPKSDLLEEEEKYLEAFKVTIVLKCVIF